ncbi:hypothetical protein [Paraglaciecola sp. 25GB23A]|uniref:post-PEP-CTERM-1 domain-containing protein n=1 Tax=Paraglaciecola sp. 25GB23A TaxID=3156068 RepID=UPI0032AED026
MKMIYIFAVATLAATLVAPSAPAAEPTAATEALRVIRDKQTGQLRAPNNQELKDMLNAEKAARKARGESEPSAEPQQVEVRTYNSGMKSAVLGPEYLISLEAHRDADGNLVVTHSNPKYRAQAELPKE